jgi:uncharacterized protein
MADRSTRVRVRVSAGARRSELVGQYGDAWKVRVAAPPKGGRANEAVVQLLAETLDVPRRDVKISSGVASREKVIAVQGLEADEADRRLRRAHGS